MVVIELDPSLSDFTQRTTLDDREYVFHFRWNQRAERWFFSLADQDSVSIVDGQALVIGFPLLRLVRDARAPTGALVAVDTTLRDNPPGLGDLGARVKLLYFPLSDLLATSTESVIGLASGFEIP